jgi:hypothetical protein
MADEGIELLMEMLNAGNTDVQLEVFDYITNVDRDGKHLPYPPPRSPCSPLSPPTTPNSHHPPPSSSGKMFNHLKARMQSSIERIKDRKVDVKDGYVKCSQEVKDEYENAMQTFELLQQLCEGHNLVVQDLLREQPSHSGNINLIVLVIDTLVCQCDSSSALKKMEQCEIDMVNSTLDVLIEVVQGPCLGNQLEIVNSDVLSVIKNLLPSPFHKRIDRRERLMVKNKAILLVSSLLEGREDKLAHMKLADDLEAVLLDNFCESVYKHIEMVYGDSNLGFEEQEEMAGEANECLVSLKSVYNELKLVEKFAKQGECTSRVSDQGRAWLLSRS